VSTAGSEVPIQLNGEVFPVPPGSTLADLIRHLELPADRVAVELDRHVVRRPEWASHTLQPGSRVEIVQLVGGG
jgi:sulfur carrier protein